MDKVFTACRNGDLRELKRYFDTGLVDANAEDDSGMTLLMHACEHGHLSVVKYLLENQNTNVASQDEKKMTPLMHASSHGHLPVVIYLLERLNGENATVEHTKEICGTALTHACTHGHLPVVTYLVENKEALTSHTTPCSNHPARTAVMHGHLSIVQYLLKNMNFQHAENERTECIKSACSQGNLKVVRCLLDGNVSVSNKSLHEVAQEACTTNQLSILEYILEEKFNDNLLSFENIRDYIAISSEKNHLEIVRYLFQMLQRKDFQLTDVDNRKLLFNACKHTSLSVVKYLLEERKLYIETKGDRGRTCLMEACLQKSFGLIKYLIEERSADVNAKDDDGITPLMYACQVDCFPIARYFVEERNANVEEMDKFRNNCLTHAFRNKSQFLTRYLMYDCQMDFPRNANTYSHETKLFMEGLRHDPNVMKRKRRQCVKSMRQFIQRRELQEDWNLERDITFQQVIPLRITHNYQFIENNNPNTLSDLKVYFGVEGSSKSEVVYARKEKLSKSCTFMENLLTGEMNDVKDDPDDPGMQMVELNQELLGDCPRDLLKELIIFLSWSKDGESIQHYIVECFVDDHASFPYCSIVSILIYCRTVNALGIELNLSEWTLMIGGMVRTSNMEWIRKKGKLEHIPRRESLAICRVTPFDSVMSDLWIEMFGESQHKEDIYFFMLVHAAPVSASCTTSIAPQCRDWLSQHGKNHQYKDALENDAIGAHLIRTTGFDVKTGKVLLPISEVESFVKRKRQRIESMGS